MYFFCCPIAASERRKQKHQKWRPLQYYCLGKEQWRAAQAWDWERWWFSRRCERLIIPQNEVFRTKHYQFSASIMFVIVYWYPNLEVKIRSKKRCAVCRSGRTRGGQQFGELVRWWIMSRWPSQIISIVCFRSTLWLCQNSYWKWPEK